MAIQAPGWLKRDPELPDAARWWLKQLAEELTGLAGSLTDDEAMVVAVRMVNELDRVKAQLPDSLERLALERLQKQPEPPGVDWACESPTRAADVVAMCRRMHRRRTGMPEWRWISDLLDMAQAGYINNRLWGRWRRGEVPVDRRLVVAALKLAMVEDARELMAVESGLRQ